MYSAYIFTSNKMPILLVRHAERADYVAKKCNKNWIKVSQTMEPWNPPLSQRGIRQAYWLGKLIEREISRLGLPPVARIFSSPFHRCLQTAVGAIEGLGGSRKLKVAIEPSLVESYFI